MKGPLVLSALAMASCHLIAGLDGYDRVDGVGAGGMSSSAGSGGQAGEGAVTAFQYGAATNEREMDVVLYDEQSAAVVGLFDGELVFEGARPLSTSFPNSLFVAEVGDDGMSQWAMQVDGSFEAPRMARLAGGRSIAVAAATFSAPMNTVDFGPFPLFVGPSQGAVVGVCEPRGAVSSAKVVGTGASWEVAGVAAGNVDVVVVGTFQGILVPTSAHEVSSTTGVDEGFVASFAGNTVSWVQRIYDPDPPRDAQKIGGVGMDAMGNAGVAGVCAGNVEVGTMTPMSCGEGSLLAVRYAPTGLAIERNAQAFAVSSPTVTPTVEVHAVAVAPDGKMAVAGAFVGTLQLGSVPLTSDSRALFVTLLDPIHSPIWSVASSPVGDMSRSIIRKLAFSPTGDVLAAGMVDTSITMGAQQLVPHGTEDVFIAGFEPADGEVSVANTYGGADSASVASGVSSIGSTAVIAGHFTGILEIGGATFQADTSAPDLFVAWLEQ